MGLRKKISSGAQAARKVDRAWSKRLESRMGRGLVGYAVRAFRTLDSTNSEAKRRAEEGAPEGLVVVAAEQTAGRGRRGRPWHSPPGKGVYLSVILRPPWPVADAGWLAVLGGVAAAQTLKSLGVTDLCIKWPNDLLVQGKKIGGVLVEPSVREGRIEYAVLGVGLNLAQRAEDFEGLPWGGRATSCAAEGVQVDLDEAIVSLVERLNWAYGLALGPARKRLLEAWVELGGMAVVPPTD